MKIDKVEYFAIDYNDLDRGVTDFLKSKGIDTGKYGYSSVIENDWANDSTYEVLVDGNLAYNIYDADKMERFQIPSLNYILNLMCCEGLLNKGKYLIKVCW